MIRKAATKPDDAFTTGGQSIEGIFQLPPFITGYDRVDEVIPFYKQIQFIRTRPVRVE